MSDIFMIRLHEAILFIYMLSVACYFFDFVQKNNRVKKIGFMMLVTVFVIQTLLIGQFVMEAGRFPVQTIVEGFYFFTWLIILISIILSLSTRSELITFMMNLIGFIFMAIHTFQPVQYNSDTAVSHMMNELLMIHVTLAITAYVMFLIAALHALLYLIQMNNLKKKKFNQKFFRINDLASIGRFVGIFSVAGFVLLLVSLILGIQWGLILIGGTIWTDSKVIGSMIVLFIYGVFLLLFNQKQLKVNILMEINIILFLICMINYLLLSRYSEFHQLMN
ncbi:cytochrome c biogenesis protein CcsA [Macrococcus lamae]|uniref:Cytochrome C assembly protein n=1 Tax=Macrococcus lamae TaxID=198484 RepID=A0A4R6BU90_9STAP|nr:cytochrome c biogenesis protein CcsA [Macrococcus lamae]TDM10665.1 cytochrome C assembly protein [Macrococcus lamae]